MIRHITAAVYSATVLAIATPTFAADTDKGRILARKCSACHGKQGVSRDPEVPIIAGQHAFYLEKALEDFRNGARKDRRMTLISKTLTDENIADLAAWYASFEVDYQPPE